jgi:hypothetical protein
MLKFPFWSGWLVSSIVEIRPLGFIEKLADTESMSAIRMFQQQACQTEPNRSLFTWSSRRCMLIDRGMM